MFVLESGPATAPIVLLVHALGLDHSMWVSQQVALSDESRVVMPDLPGFGRSRLESSSLDQCVEACAERLAQDGRPAIVAGVSYGGWVGVLLAAKHPDLVSGLVISGVRPDIPRYLAELQAVAFRMTPGRMLARGDPVVRSDLKSERANLIAAARELALVDLWSSLEKITAPTVVFAPSRDRFVRGPSSAGCCSVAWRSTRAASRRWPSLACQAAGAANRPHPRARIARSQRTAAAQGMNPARVGSILGRWSWSNAIVRWACSRRRAMWRRKSRVGWSSSAESRESARPRW